MRIVKIIILILILGLVSIAGCHLLDLRRLDMPDAKWMWIQKVLHERAPEKVDYVFVGSSRTWCAVRPVQIGHAIPDTSSWNLGRHWIGRDIDYLLLEELLKRHKVGHVFIEIIGQENFAPHQYAKYIISPIQAYDEAGYHLAALRWRDVWTYSDQFKERVKHLLGYVTELAIRLYRVGPAYVWQRLEQRPQLATDIRRNEESRGFFIRDAVVKPKPHFVEEYGRFRPFFPVAKGPFIIPPGSYPDYYLRKIQKLAARHGAQLSFVFISDFAAVLPHDQMFHYYQGMGEVYIPSLRRMYRSELWRDKNHLYGEGAEIMTDEIIRLLSEGVAASDEHKQYIPAVP